MAYLEYEPRSTLFQFTSVEGFRGIVESKQLWFSDLKALNDPREVILGLGKVREVIEEIVSENQGWDSRFLRSILDQCYSYVKTTRLFTCSFCPSGDLMPLWQHYGAAGEGIAIGFRPRAVHDTPGRIQRVEYIDSRTPTKDLKQSLYSVIEPFSRMKSTPNLEQQIILGSEIAAKCTSIKHSTWSHEMEIRAVYAQSSERSSTHFLGDVTSLNSDGSTQKWQKPLTRTTGNGEVQYIPFHYGKLNSGTYDPSGSIETVFVGPRSKITVPEVTAILHSEGFRNFEVLSSECVWR